MSISSVFRGLLDLVAPPRCAACEERLDPGGAGFCDACAPLLEEAADGEPAAFLYGGPLADAIQRMKYGPRSELAAPLGALMVPRAIALGHELDRVVPVPLHPRRLRQRGFNQAALLARPLARALGLHLSVAPLVRIRDTAQQASLERQQRARNVEGAFRARNVEGLRVLLVDDVRTTGATLAAAAEALRAAGAKRVHTLVLARVEA